MTVTREDDHLVIRIPLQDPALSKTGKTYIVATSHGGQKTDVIVEGKPVTVSVNAFIKP